MADIIVHPNVFLLFAAAGMAAGLLYSLLRGLRGGGKHRMATGLLDLFFCFLAALLFAACSYIALSGQIRAFSAAAYAIGFAVFYAGPGGALSKTVARGTAYVSKNVKRAGDALNRLLAKKESDE